MPEQQLPAPLTPPDCDLRAFRDMPLDVQAFRDSDLVTQEEPEIVMAALWLWTAAWHQVPAASLPDDDRALSRFAGYGRSLVSWRAVRDGALRGFVRCSDGRLYHRVLARKAISAWAKRLEHEWRRAKDRHRKDQKDRPQEERSEFPDFDRWLVSRAHGCNPDANQPESTQNRQQTLPLESHGNSSGTASVCAPAHDAPAHTGAKPVPIAKRGNSEGSARQFQRNGHQIPADFALKGREGKGLESSHSHSHEPTREEPESESGDNLLTNSDLLGLYEAVCDAAGFHPIDPTRIGKAQDIVKGWRDAGYDFARVVLPSIRTVMASAGRDRTRSLTRFRDEIVHQHARLSAAPATYREPETPILEPADEHETFRPIRAELLERLGPDLYSASLNAVRFEAEGQSGPVRLRGPERLIESLVHGRNAGTLKAVVTSAGFSDVWKG